MAMPPPDEGDVKGVPCSVANICVLISPRHPILADADPARPGMPKPLKNAVAFIACSVAIFWPGAFIFGFPGVLGPYWQQTFEVGRTEVGKSLFFLLTGAGSFMYLIGRWQERLGFPRVTALGA